VPLGAAGQEDRAAIEGAVVHNLPFASIGEMMRGREEELRELLYGESAMAITQAIKGLGGIGKSRLAVELGWRAVNDCLFRAVLFVVADSPASLNANLAGLAAKLGLPEAKEQAAQVESVLQWLEQSDGWLLIFDNADTEDAAGAVLALLPRLNRGRVLITSRRVSWPASVRPLELKKLDEETSLRFLLDRAKGRVKTDHDEADARTLARLLDGLPLALEQAAAYIEFNSLTFAKYLLDWEKDRARVLEWCDKNCGVPEAVAVTWQRTWDMLHPPARTLLRLAAHLAPEPIPLALFENSEARLSEACKLLEDVKKPPKKINTGDAVSELSRYSMTERGEETFSVHRIVQEAIRLRIPEKKRREWVEAALNLVNDYFPKDPPAFDVRSWNRWNPMRPHVAAIVDATDRIGIAEPTARLMNNFGIYLYTRAAYTEAEPLYRRALAIDEASYGPDHPAVARDLNNLAQLLQDTNRLDEAEPLMRRTLAIDEASYGPDHPAVARDLNNLAQLLHDTNRLAEAEPLMRRALEIDEESYGPDHPDVAIDLNNLATLLQDTNRLAEAEPLMRRALEIDEASYGPDHPNVAIRLNNLATLLHATNRLTEAEPLIRRALAILRASFDEDHPYVRTLSDNLKDLLGE